MQNLRDTRIMRCPHCEIVIQKHQIASNLGDYKLLMLIKSKTHILDMTSMYLTLPVGSTKYFIPREDMKISSLHSYFTNKPGDKCTHF